jgi:Cdc6-like AAA superfamily ATPase
MNKLRPPRIRINPFKPNSPIHPGMFTGRASEVERLEAHLLQTRAGQASNFMITGERGIGKSSLLNYIKWVAEGHIAVDGLTMNFLVIDTDVDQSTTQLGLIKKIERALRHSLGRSEPARNFLHQAWSFLQRVEAAGTKVNKTEAPDCDEVIFDEFAYSLAEIVQRVTDESRAPDLFNARYDGVLILIDEADNAGKHLQLGSFLKLLTERVQRRGCDCLMIGLAGLPELRRVLSDSHRSSLRLFEELPLDRLSREEVVQVIDVCVRFANKKSTRVTKVTTDAKDALVALSEGYPHFIQQFGFSAFTADEDGSIDGVDVTNGAFGARGALELIGDRYYRNDFYGKIQRDSYRQVLRIMADRLDSWVTKAEIRDRFKGNESTLDNAIKALRDRHIILSKEGERGIYRLQQKAFAFWIKLCTEEHTEADRLA